jgi:multisubunit Na+/H+ antiporter MnhG subunit
MTACSIATGILLGAAVVLAILCAVGVLVMRDPLQRLQFSAAVVGLSAGLIAVAVWLEESDAQARIKVLLIWAVLFVMNSILTHATARAFRIRRVGRWRPQPEEGIPVIGRNAAAGQQGPHP